jgi:hypothetical protein
LKREKRLLLLEWLLLLNNKRKSQILLWLLTLTLIKIKSALLLTEDKIFFDVSPEEKAVERKMKAKAKADTR